MVTVNIHEAKTQLSKLVERASKGERVIIARAGKPVAMLGPVCATAPRDPGLLKGRVKMASDFDAEMPAEWMQAFHSGHIEPE